MIKIVLKESKHEIKSLRETVGQHFDFDGNKREILTFIEKVMKGENPASRERESDIFYTLITNSSQIKTGVSLTGGFTKDAVKAWKDYFGSKPTQLSEKTEFYTDGIWTQYSVNRKTFPKKTEKGRTYNFYITIKKDKKNIVEFVNNFWRFGVAMEQLSDQLKTPLAYKTHSILDSMYAHNDSLKIYFYDATHANKIANAVKNLVTQMGVEVMPRTHDIGVDKRTKEEIVLDGHALSIWLGKKVAIDSEELKPLHKKVTREIIKQDFLKAAKCLEIATHDLQAVTWAVWKNTKPAEKLAPQSGGLK